MTGKLTLVKWGGLACRILALLLMFMSPLAGRSIMDNIYVLLLGVAFMQIAAWLAQYRESLIAARFYNLQAEQNRAANDYMRGRLGAAGQARPFSVQPMDPRREYRVEIKP